MKGCYGYNPLAPKPLEGEKAKKGRSKKERENAPGAQGVFRSPLEQDNPGPEEEQEEEEKEEEEKRGRDRDLPACHGEVIPVQKSPPAASIQNVDVIARATVISSAPVDIIDFGLFQLSSYLES